MFYTPPNMPELEIEYCVIPGQLKTFNQEGVAPEIDIIDAKLFDNEMSDDLFKIIFDESNREKFEKEIATHLRNEADNDF